MVMRRIKECSETPSTRCLLGMEEKSRLMVAGRDIEDQVRKKSIPNMTDHQVCRKMTIR